VAAAPAAASVIVVGPAGSERERIVEALRRADLSISTLTEEETFGQRHLAPPLLVVLVRGGPRTARQAAQVRLLSHPALHGAPLLVVSAETDVDSYGGALARGAAAYVSSAASPPEMRDLALRLVRAAERRRAEGRAGDRDRRRGRRPLLLKVEVEDRAQGARLSGHIVDIGLSGCRLELAQPLAKGTPVGLQLHAYRESTGIVLAGSVRWTRPGDGETHLVAVRFNGTSAVVARRLFGLRG
jgi:DNA-binding response OmpR family regulator